MGCLFGCFRVGDGQRRNPLISSSIPSSRSMRINEEKRASKNQLAAVFLREDKGSPDGQVPSPKSKDNIDTDKLDRELKHEAKFLKSCGALLETPVEIRKASENIHAGTLSQDGTPSVHSWLPTLPGNNLFKEGQHPEHSRSPEESHEGSCFTDAECSTSKRYQKSRRYDNASSSDYSSKFLHVEEPGSECSMGSVTSETSTFQGDDSQFPQFGTKRSPFPTPLKVTDDMQTPATVYPTVIEKLKAGKSSRVRTQYVYPVLNLVENLAQWKVLSETPCESSHSQGSPANDETMERISKPSASDDSVLNMSLVLNKNNLSIGTVRTVSGDKIPSSQDDPELVVTSLSQWLKPKNDKDRWTNEMLTKGKSHSGKSSDGDRPIIGMVAAHWSEEEPGRFPPKWWDGNGIPNSTNKYKEDQKVSWHATPFEERLEKALSDEKLLSHRKCSSGKPIEFKDKVGESDTAES